jgi:hypothetical protein
VFLTCFFTKHFSLFANFQTFEREREGENKCIVAMEGSGASGAEAHVCVCEAPDVDMGTEFGFSGRRASTIIHGAVFPFPSLLFSS